MGRNYCDFKGVKNPRYKTGLSGRKHKHSGVYNSWQNMKQRCLNPKHPKYKRYGGRGVKVCEEWMDIKDFYDWSMNNGWQKGLSIDRIDNDGDYKPSNCRWISQSENSRKKSTTKITFEQAQDIRERALFGECELELAKEYGVVHGTIWFIVNNLTHVQEGECAKKLKERKRTS